jgi:hypothetical protein
MPTALAFAFRSARTPIGFDLRLLASLFERTKRRQVEHEAASREVASDRFGVGTNCLESSTSNLRQKAPTSRPACASTAQAITVASV